MAKKRSFLIAGLAAGAYAYFRNPENREKATVAFNNAKLKVNSFMESQNLEGNDMADKNSSNPENPRENKMVNEGALTSVQYYNEAQQEELEQEKKKLSSNDTDSEKS